MAKRSASMRASASCPPTRRAQAAIEVLIYLGFFMIVFVSLSVMLLTQIAQDTTQRQYLLSQSIAAQVADDVETAFLAGPGFNATFPIPSRISGKFYTLTFTDTGLIRIELDEGINGLSNTTYSFPLSTRRVRLGCADEDICPGNGLLAYNDMYGRPHTEWWVNSSDGTLGIEYVQDPSGILYLQVR